MTDREKFEKWVVEKYPESRMMQNTLMDNEGFFAVWQSRQAEIDALKVDLDSCKDNRERFKDHYINTSRICAEFRAEAYALKDELGLCRGTIESRDGNIESLKAEIKRLQEELEPEMTKEREQFDMWFRANYGLCDIPYQEPILRAWEARQAEINLRKQESEALRRIIDNQQSEINVLKGQTERAREIIRKFREREAYLEGLLDVE